MAKRIEDISQYIKQMKFKKRFFGGVDEYDVFNKIEKLNQEYKELYDKQNSKIELLEKLLDEKR